MTKETPIIKKMAKINRVSNTREIYEITYNIQRLDTPNLICGMRSNNVSGEKGPDANHPKSGKVLDQCGGRRNSTRLHV